MSLARSLTASWMTRLHSLTTGAAFSPVVGRVAGLLRFREVDLWVSVNSASMESTGFRLALAVVLVDRFEFCSRSDRTGWMSLLRMNRSLSRVSMSSGLEITIWRALFSCESG